MTLRLATALAAVIFASPAAMADGRYVFNPVEGGLARLDTQTGAVSLCRMEGASLVCRLAADDREIYEKRIATLEGMLGNGGAQRTAEEPSVDEQIETFKSTTRKMLDALIDLRGDFERLERAYEDPPRRGSDLPL